jgi:hypothetical protein
VKAILVLAVAAAALTVAASTAASSPGFVSFRTPSRIIGCTYSPAESGRKAFLRCDIRRGLRPKPSGKCRLARAGLGMTVRGKAHPVCAGDTGYNPLSPILRYGHRWKHGGFTCHSRRKGLTCSNRAGHGFFLSRKRWRVH